jgi:hypothetical protein
MAPVPIDNVDAACAATLKRLSRQTIDQCEPREQLYYELAGSFRGDTIEFHVNVERLWWRIIEQFPRDLAAAKLLQTIYFNRGDTFNSLRVADTIFEHNKENHFAYGMRAWGLVELNRVDEAEQVGRTGVRMAPQGNDPWAQHSVAHCMHSQGRVDEGIAWLEGFSSQWEDCHSFMYTHNWWHVSLVAILYRANAIFSFLSISFIRFHSFFSN